MSIKYFKVCRVKCLECGAVLEHVNHTKEDNCGHMMYCQCGKVGLDPSTSLYRIVTAPGAQFEDLSEEWEA